MGVGGNLACIAFMFSYYGGFNTYNSGSIRYFNGSRTFKAACHVRHQTSVHEAINRSVSRYDSILVPKTGSDRIEELLENIGPNSV